MDKQIDIRRWCTNCGEWLPEGWTDLLCGGCRADANDTDKDFEGRSEMYREMAEDERRGK